MTLRRRPPDCLIPTSSLADVAFLLLVFFLVTSVFADSKGLAWRVPERAEAPPREAVPERALHVRLAGDGRVLLDGAALDPAEVDGAVVTAVLASVRRRADRPVLVTAEATARYGALVTVLDALARAEAAARSERLLPPGGRLRVTIPSLRELDELRAAHGAGVFD